MTIQIIDLAESFRQVTSLIEAMLELSAIMNRPVKEAELYGAIASVLEDIDIPKPLIDYIHAQIKDCGAVTKTDLKIAKISAPVYPMEWLRPDWTPELFLAATPDYTDAQRCEAVLLTRDIPLISWYVNARAGRPRATTVDQGRLESQLKIIQGELNEAVKSVEALDGAHLRDDQADLFLVVGGLGAFYPSSMNDDFVFMVSKNFTRIDGTYADAVKTQQLWLERGVKCEISEKTAYGTFPVLVSEPSVYKEDNMPVGKFLKSYKFEDSDFETLDQAATATIIAK